MAELAGQKPQLTPLLTNEALTRLERLRFQSARRFTTRSRGEHLAGRSGTSTEFCDYRDYADGDDIRWVDWNIFARLNRPYLKLFHQEEEMHLVILVDASTSMMADGKLEQAKRLAAAFGVVGLYSTERVSVYAFGQAGRQPVRLPPSIGRASMMRLFDAVEGIEGGGEVTLEKAAEALLRAHAGRGVALMLSDFLTFGDLPRAFNRLFGSGMETYGIQILAPEEINPDVTGDIRLLDSESADTLDVSSASDLLSLYQDHRAAYEEELATLCRQRSGRFLSISSRDAIEWVLFDLLRRKGWLR